jgi:hypothetical protein
VRFTITAGGGTLQQVTPLGQATTDADGVAICTWTIGQGPDQRVIAELLDGTQRRHLPIQFSATIAGEPGLHIVDVVRLKDINTTKTPLINDTDIHFNDFAAGIGIVCDDAIEPDTIRKRPTCFVTLEWPTFFAPIVAAPQYLIYSYIPQVLAADADIQDKTIITWIAPDPTLENLRRALSNLMWSSLQMNPVRVLARLTLKGNFIWSSTKDAKNPGLFLDGEAFGVRAKPDPAVPTELRLPQSGDRRRGGDFEMWFYLTWGPANPKTFQVTSVDFRATVPPPVHSSTAGIVTGPFPLTSPPRFTAAESVNQIDLKFNRAIGWGSLGVTINRITATSGSTLTVPVASTQIISTDQIRIALSAPLTVVGQYRLFASPGIFAKDDGAPLDGDFNDTPGGDFVLWFTATGTPNPVTFRVASVEFIMQSSQGLLVTVPLNPPNRTVSFPAASGVNSLVIYFNRAIGFAMLGPISTGGSVNLQRLQPAPQSIAGTCLQGSVNDIRITTAAVLPAGDYRLTISGTTGNAVPFGNAVFANDDATALDGNFDGGPGGDFVLLFKVTPPMPPPPLSPPNL